MRNSEGNLKIKMKKEYGCKKQEKVGRNKEEKQEEIDEKEKAQQRRTEK